MSKRLTRTSKSVAHHLPGRTRIKVPKSHRKQLHKIKDEIEKRPGVKSVEVNHDTGSVIVEHEHEAPIFEILHTAVEAVGGDLITTMIEGGAATEVIGPLGIVAAAVGIFEGVGKAVFSSEKSNQRVLTGQASDLKTLVPTAFLIAAGVKYYQTQTFWQGVTPILLCYWAFDTYWRFNVANPQVFEPKNGQVTHDHSHPHERKA